jgi:FkbM family methyltransferase
MALIEEIILKLPEIKDQHVRGGEKYNELKTEVRGEVEKIFADVEAAAKPFPPFGEIVFPYHKMGAIDSLNLFDLDELIIFSFYWLNRKRYKKVADIGANIGLHSIILSKCGYEVRCFEPDPKHFEIIKRNLALNNAGKVEPINAAVSAEDGELEFIRVLGNTTGSHIAGAKDNPYGELDKFPVEVKAIGPIMEWADLIKLDAEGHEREILLATTKEHWANTDALMEIQNDKNAKEVYGHFKKIGVNMFSQKINWQKVERLEDVPVGYKEGTLFVSMKEEMPWA